MFEGFPFLRGQALGYRAYFLATFIVASLYQLLLVAVFRLASRAGLARSTAAEARREAAHRAYFECLAEGHGKGRAEGWGSLAMLRRSGCARVSRWVKPHTAASFALFVVACLSYMVCVVLAFGHSSWAGRMVALALCWSTLSVLVFFAQMFSPPDETADDDTRACHCTRRRAFSLCNRVMIDFDARYPPLLAALMLVSSTVSFSALEFLSPFWGVLLTYVVLSPFFLMWCRCCACCTPHNGICYVCSRRAGRTNRTHTAFSMRFFDDAEEGATGTAAVADGPLESSTGSGVSRSRATEAASELVALGSLSHESHGNSDDSVSISLENMRKRRPPENCAKSMLPMLVNQGAALCLAAIMVWTTRGTCIGFFASNLFVYT